VVRNVKEVSKKRFARLPSSRKDVDSLDAEDTHFMYALHFRMNTSTRKTQDQRPLQGVLVKNYLPRRASQKGRVFVIGFVILTLTTLRLFKAACRRQHQESDGRGVEPWLRTFRFPVQSLPPKWKLLSPSSSRKSCPIDSPSNIAPSCNL
jgi:hypothetical protein